MASQEGVIVFLPFLLSVMLLHHHFPTSVISAESDNLTLPLFSPPTHADDQVSSNIINGGTELIQSDSHTSPSPPPSEIQKNVPSNSNLKEQKIQSPPPPPKSPIQTGEISPSISNIKLQRSKSPPPPPTQTNKIAPGNSNLKVQRYVTYNSNINYIFYFFKYFLSN
ncbi:uncharacterized protein [Phaseolus vulgaris]|uniref:uncharacterized protein n=1 Tax=Phaseolus vulgaris TaxID=3885 RepID=UPI0035C9CBC0